MSQATLDEQPIEPSLAPETAFPAALGPACEKCGRPNTAAACQHCGWYPVLGIHVEIDDAYEAVMLGPQAAVAEGAAAPKQPGWEKHLAVWASLIPWWGWLMVGTTLACVAAGVAARLATLGNPTLQTWCGVGGLVGGLSIAAVCHVVAFVLCSFEDANFGVADLIIKPLKTWKQIASGLPKYIAIANGGNFGVSLALSAALIVGGVPYERLLDWGFKAPPKQSLVGAIASAASQAKGDDNKSLEEAVNEFAGDAGVDQLSGDAAGKPPAAVKPREKLECLIIGYHAGKSGGIQSLLLATDSGGKLQYVGQVTPAIEAAEAIELLKKFERSLATRPFVKTSESAVWLRPRFTCRVTYREWPNGARPKDLQWDQMLDEVKLPW
ncbi:hypothetical protein [Botrimarina mediterranea]|uniref:DNA ligase (ATP) n=1 Tax=Botrimarina mediterranea TaxID=2528022 RepID=A0A518K6L3_9BACT|nr:hypothetical protein [Botrimarina mediterranea]QDV73417.1 ATP-dependent DNA ligase [Botrimarina mediterranea]QDV77934.1 ATP-dependent DNA ligase [Planctomycetes bacterium K2D]